ncbi:MAG: (Fe-S)-binding protein [Desulfosudaceae bacterium]
MFDKDKCELCGECRRQCLYIDYPEGTEAPAMEKLSNGQIDQETEDWLRQCLTCFACNEYCPNDARPFDLILERLEQLGDYVNPDLLPLAEQMFTPRTSFAPKATGPVALSLCTIYASIPWAFSGSLFDHLPQLKGTHFFCHLIYPHLGNESLLRKKLPELLAKYAELEAETIIFAHDDCYAVMTDAVPRHGLELSFKPVHLYEYLRDTLKQRQSEIRPLNMKVAYQRPCASRLTPWKEPCLDEIFDLIGVERVDRRYDRGRSLCCGQDMGGIQSRGPRFPEFKDINLADAAAHGAGAMAYLCPMCLDALGRNARQHDLDNYMVSDLCRLALGETLPEEAYAGFR